MKDLRLFCFLMSLIFNSHADSAELLHVRKIIDQAEMALNFSSVNFENQCLLANGNKPFCECLTKGRPIFHETYISYVSLVTQSRGDVQYDEITEELQKVYDMTLNVRNSCVEKFSQK